MLDLLDRHAKELREERELALWALKSAHSLGRKFPEEEDDLRTAWERDRDRMVHSTALPSTDVQDAGLRQLGGRPLPHAAVAQPRGLSGRSLDRERAALERAVHRGARARATTSAIRRSDTAASGRSTKLMKDHGGFRHNFAGAARRRLARATQPRVPGLNLTRELRESLLEAREDDLDWPDEFRPRPRQPYLEAQVVDLADSTAYVVHDLEDGSNAGMFRRAAAARGEWRCGAARASRSSCATPVSSTRAPTSACASSASRTRCSRSASTT
jgi:dGTPase